MSCALNQNQVCIWCMALVRTQVSKKRWLYFFRELKAENKLLESLVLHVFPKPLKNISYPNIGTCFCFIAVVVVVITSSTLLFFYFTVFAVLSC